MGRVTGPADAVVIGAGVNGLTAAALLGGAGMRVVVLERRHRPGGACVTEEVAPGFRGDACGHSVGWVPPAMYAELGLGREGLELLRPDPAVFAVGPDGPPLELYRGAAGTAAALRRHSAEDAERWPAFRERITRFTAVLRELYAVPPPRPVGPGGLREALGLLRSARGMLGLGRSELVELLRVLPMSVADLLDEWFESDVLKGTLAARGVAGVFQGPRSGGTAFGLLHHSVGGGGAPAGPADVVRGGAGRLAAALASAATRRGVEIRYGAEVTAIDVRDGRARAAVLAGGEEVAGRAVVSSADPRRTLLDLVGPPELDPEVVRAVRNIRFRGCWAKVNLALGELPAFPGDPLPPGTVLSVTPGVDGLERAFDRAKHGGVSDRPHLEATIPSRGDPSLAPPGGHVMSVVARFAPYRLGGTRGGGGDAAPGVGDGPGGRRDGVPGGRDDHGGGRDDPGGDRAGRAGPDAGGWDERRREALGDRVVEILAEHAPGLPGAILHRRVLAPPDLERVYGLPEGSEYQGELGLDQVLFMRPIPGWSRYRTPVRDLWLCGAGTHPGGAIAGASGRIAAGEILRELGGRRVAPLVRRAGAWGR